jgi:hypothetical protein
LTIFTGDENGALIYSHYQNSKTVWINPTKLGGHVKNGLLEDWDIDFLPGSVHKLRVELFYNKFVTLFQFI